MSFTHAEKMFMAAAAKANDEVMKSMAEGLAAMATQLLLVEKKVSTLESEVRSIRRKGV
jgi:hypothetical protein